MFLVKTEGTIITELLCGPETWLDKPGYVRVHDYFGGFPGMDVGNFSKAGGTLTGLLPLADRISKGFVVVPDTHRVVGEEIVQKSLDELVADGVVKLAKTQMVDKGEIREMTAEEQVKAGVLKIKPTQQVTGNLIEDKTTTEMYIDGTMPIPPEIRIVNGAIQERSELSMQLDGTHPLPPGMKIEVNGSVRTLGVMTIDEQVSAGQMTRQTASTIKAVNARAERDTLLSGSDWTQVPDVVLSDSQKAEWKTYRQALRDVPEQGGFPDSVIWPTSPDGVKA